MKLSVGKAIAWVISVLFHPLTFTNVGAIVILFWYPEYVQLHPVLKSQFFSSFFMLTYVLPIIAVPLYYLIMKLLKVEVSKHHARLFLLLTTTGIYAFAYKVLQDITMFQMVNMYLLLCTVIMLISLVITYFWKISLHMIGVGGYVGLLLALLFGEGVFNQVMFASAVLVAGLIGFARLYLRAHTPTQVYTGFGMSAVISFIFLFMLFISG